MKLTDRELATILAALRYWQREGLTSGGSEIDVATDNGIIDELDRGEIDDLCERLNTSDASDEAPDILSHMEKGFIEAAKKMKFNLL